MSTRTLLLASLLACGLGTPAQAQVGGLTWEDPSLRAAVKDADLIVLAKALRVGKMGAAYKVERTLKGPDRKGETLAIVGLHHPQRHESPPVKVGDRAYLLLRGKPRGPGFSLPTPTFGRFPVRTFDKDETLVVASLGGVESFVRLGVPPKRFEALLKGLIQGKAPALLTKAEAVLGKEEPDSEALYFALRCVALFPTGKRRRVLLPKVATILRDQRYQNRRLHQIRIASCRALGALGGSKASRLLLKVAEKDALRAVRSVAAASVARALRHLRRSPQAGEAAKRLATLAAQASTHPVSFASSKDPRTNKIDSPLMACLGSLSRLRPQLGVAPALKALRKEDGEAVLAGLTFFATLNRREHVGEIVACMRPKGHRDAFINRLFGETLTRITGKRLGTDPAAWKAWWKANRPASAGPK